VSVATPNQTQSKTPSVSPPSVSPISTLFVDPALYSLYPLDCLIQYVFIPLYISDSRVGICTFLDHYTPKLIQSDFPHHEIDVIPVSEWTFYQLLYKPYLSVDTDMNLFPLLFMGIIHAASDIHLSATKTGYACQFRVSGQLKSIPFTPPKNINMAQLIKLHSHMDLSLHQHPQDGRLFVSMPSGNHPIRVSSVPSLYGEDFVFRLFSESGIPSLPALGFSKPITSQLMQLITLQSGLILVTGPTGAGKSTTLYSVLKQINHQCSKKIITLEDPIEHPLPGIRQSQINIATGYSFSAGLRSVLRQDPDVIMIGEIRDSETAKIAIEAAYTGHLVLATLHTQECKESLLRLASFDIDPFFLTYTLKGVLSQRLLPTSPRQVVGEWLSPTPNTVMIKSYNDIDQYIHSCYHIPFEGFTEGLTEELT
jgi:Tfp pilus assembly pilus retraction ATPase PilT